MKKLFGIVFLAVLFCMNAAAAEHTPVYQIGDTIEDFTVTFSDGESITLSEVLEEKEMVLIHICETRCDSCFSALTEMEKAYVQYQDQIEILTFSCETEDTYDARKTFEEIENLSFRIAQDTPDFCDKFGLMEVPSSIVVDRFGTICFIGEAVSDADAFVRLFEAFTGDEYEESVLLTEIPSEKPRILPSDAAAYTIRCIDQNGTPVSGVMVQICDAVSCQAVQTDAEGMYTFTSEPCVWEVHILAAPEGYTAEQEEAVCIPEAGGELILTLKKH